MSLGRILVLAGLLVFPVESQAQTGAGTIEVDFTVPSGYAARSERGWLHVVPQTTNSASPPCTYSVAPSRPSKGSLDADAEAALANEVADARLRRSNDYLIGMRGTAAAGWEYFLTGGNFVAPTAGGNLYLTVMAMAMPASGNRVSVVVAFGSASGCVLNNVPFAQFFYSLRPRNWPDPPANPLARDLIGAWQGSALSGRTFHPDGRYSSSAAAEVFGTPLSREGYGRYTVRGSEITVTPSDPRQSPERFRAHIYDKWNNSRWERAMTVLVEDRVGLYVAEYVRAAR